MLLSAVVSVAAGALVLSQPLLTGFLAGRFVILLIGAAALAAGAIRLVQGRDGTRTWRSVLIGTTYVVLGVIVVAHPFTTQALIMLLLSAWAVAAGVLGVFAALSLRGAQKAGRLGLTGRPLLGHNPVSLPVLRARMDRSDGCPARDRRSGWLQPATGNGRRA